MTSVRLTAMRWVDADFCPPIVELHLRQADGSIARFEEKEAVVDTGRVLSLDVAFPVELVISREVLDRDVDGSGRAVALVRLPWQLEDVEGRERFRVLVTDLIT